MSLRSKPCKVPVSAFKSAAYKMLDCEKKRVNPRSRDAIFNDYRKIAVNIVDKWVHRSESSKQAHFKEQCETGKRKKGCNRVK